MRFEAALFDLDGTMQDSEIHWCYATADFLRSRNIEITDEEAVKLVYGRSCAEISNDVLRDHPELKMETMEVSGGFKEFYFKRLEKYDISFPTSVALLKAMAKDMPVAIVSGSEHSVVELSARNIKVLDDLSLILGAEDYPRGKPDPICFLKAAELLKVDPKKCIVFEDSSVGVAAAKAAGMYCVAISREDRPKQDVSQADEVVSDLGEWKYISDSKETL